MSKKTKITISILSVLIFSLSLTWKSFFITRVLIWNYVSITDYQIFPERMLQAGNDVFTFAKDTTQYNGTKIDQDFDKKFGFKNVGGLDQLMRLTESTAFIVLQNDTIIYEKYCNGYQRHSINTSFSIAKSVTSALIGIALHEGFIENINDPISKYLPELKGSEQNEAITIRHLLTMASGIAYDSESEVFSDEARAYYEPDLRKYALSFEIAEPPGRHFEYNNIHPLLLGIILERTTGRSVTQYLEEKVWQPLGMEFPGSWSLDNSGFEKMESGINARAIDFLKFGRLFLQDGFWEGQQIIPAEYVEESTIVSSDSVLNGVIRNISYKYFWWIYPRYEGRNDYYAEGNLGQFLYISPERNTIIVRHGKEYGYGRWPDFLFKFVNELSTVVVKR